MVKVEKRTTADVKVRREAFYISIRYILVVTSSDISDDFPLPLKSGMNNKIFLISVLKMSSHSRVVKQ